MFFGVLMVCTRLVACICFALALGMLGRDPVVAGKFNRKLSVGDAAPMFKELVGIDGKTHSLPDLKKAKVVVVAITCNHCPVASGYEERFVRFASDYRPKEVEFVAINCGRLATDGLEQMKKRAEESKFNFAYLQDADQKTAADFGATVTPHLFVLDADRKVAYMGAFDDSFDPRKIETNYVRDAVDAILAGKKPEIRESRQFGCAIDYK